MAEKEKIVPEIHGKLRSFMLKVPPEIYNASGIRIFGKRIKSILFSTDVSIIRNTNADSIIAVYPFTPQPIITRAVMLAADVPVFCGVGGGLTGGYRVVNLAIEAEQQGAMGVVVNAPTASSIIEKVAENIDIPIIVTVVNNDFDPAERLAAGASIFNVSAAQQTPQIVASIRAQFPNVPIIATGGPKKESIAETIAAGANAITWTPPSNGEVFADIMKAYRDNKAHP
jgi:2-keto-3-deoxy-6-phosphogluconate aldolase